LFSKSIKHKLQAREQKGEFQMTNDQINSNQEPNDNQLSDGELEEVAGGRVLSDLADAGKEFLGDVVDKGKEFISDVNNAWDKLK
jgi:hypothetical protein